MNQRSSATTPVALSGDFSTACVTLGTPPARSAPAGRNVALLVTARLTTERANNDVWPSRRVRVIELSSSTTAAVKIGRDSATADPACAKMLALAATNRHKASVDVPVQNLRGSGSGKFPISHAVFASSFALGRDQAPVSRQAWTKGAADKSIVIEIPHGRSLHRGAAERIIG